MGEPILIARGKWLRSALLTLLLSIAIDLVPVAFFGLTSLLFGEPYLADDLPVTFHTLWEIAALWSILYLIRVYRQVVSVFLALVFVGAMIFQAVWTFAPQRLGLLEARYTGIEYQEVHRTHFEGRPNDRVVYADPPIRLGLYKTDDPQLQRELQYQKSNDNVVRLRGFLFWQTGLVHGFDAFRVPSYHRHGFWNHIELICTVGPLVIVESVIKAATSTFLILFAAQIALFLLRREYFWSF